MWQVDDHSYGMLVPVVSAYILWEKRKALFAAPRRPSWLGFALLVPAVALFWLGELGGEYLTLNLSLWLAIVGSLVALLGWARVRVIAYPVCLLLAAFPMPSFLYHNISLRLKLLSSVMGVWLMRIWGLPVFREGNIIDLGFTRLQVVDACSGLRYLTPLIVLGLVVAYFYKARTWKRFLLVAATVPLSIFTNSLRVALTGILFEPFGDRVAKGFFHGFSGWFIFMVTLAALLLLMLILEKVFPENRKKQAPEEEPEAPSPFREPGRRVWAAPQFWILCLVFLSTLVLAHGVEFREKIPSKRPFSSFPMEIGGFHGTRGALDPLFLERLDLSDYVATDYANAPGDRVSFYVAYYQSQSKGKSVHSPETCLPGGGWTRLESGRVRLPGPGGKGQGLVVVREVMKKGRDRVLVYYWFPQRGRVLQSMMQLKLYAFWDALTRQRTDGALVRISTTLLDGETTSDGDRRILRFSEALLPVLEQYIPGREGAD